LQKGKNTVAKRPAIHNGINTTFAKYKPANIKNNADNFLITDDSDVFMSIKLFIYR
jgi:co-chaperonin GroES (HSP10)